LIGTIGLSLTYVPVVPATAEDGRFRFIPLDADAKPDGHSLNDRSASGD
jgi:hypothetical protein